jgi:hypothetical protein
MTEETEVNVKLNPNHPMVKSVLNLAIFSGLENKEKAVQTVADMLMATMIFAHMMDVGETDNLMNLILAGQRDSAKVADRLLTEMQQDAGK